MAEQPDYTVIQEKLQRYQKETEAELQSILSWWMQHMPDGKNGFNGEIDSLNRVQKNAERGLVLNSRILWTFSASFLFTRKQEYLFTADQAFNYICTHFYDEVDGGMFWSVDCNGQKLQDKKQVYGIAFCLYGFSEYYRAAKNKQALQMAKELFYLLEKYSHDSNEKGYFEAFTRNWQPIDDLRLSDKDSNEPKSMNTHLHVLEAYTNLYKVWKNDQLHAAIISLLHLFAQKIIDSNTHQQHLFFTNDWKIRSSVVSYGHDIEASWLLYEAAEVLDNPTLKMQFAATAINMATAVFAGLDKDGGLFNEYNASTNHYIKEKHWWPQAEAMVGFFNAYQLSGNDNYLLQSFNSWTYIKKQIRDVEHGEWFWGRNEDGTTMHKEKAGFWKCPYHNSRACIEINKRIVAVSYNLKP